MEQIPQSTSRVVMLKLFLSSDHIAVATGKTLAIKLSKNGGSFADPNAGATNATEVTNGWYKVTVDTTDTATLGDLVVRGTAGSCDDSERVFSVVKATNAGLTALPDTAATTNASLLTSGTGTDQVSVSAGKVLLQATQSGVTIPTVTTVTNQLTAAQIATGVWQDATGGDFTVSSSIGKSLYTTGNAPGAASGLAIVGSAMTLAASQHVIVDSGTVTTVTNQLTAAQIATGVWQDSTAGDFTTASSIGKSLYTGNVAPGGSGGLLIAGSNAATTFAGLTTGALACTTITASGAVAFQSTFAVTTSTSLAAFSCTTLTASGAVAFQSTFATTGTTTFNALTVTNATTLSGAVSLGSTLTVTGTTTLAALTQVGAVSWGATTWASMTSTGAFTANITGTISTVTTLTNLPAITAGWLTATGIAADAITAAKIANGAIDTATFATGTTIPRCTLVDTITTYTGDTPQTGDSFARIGVAGVGLTNVVLPSGGLASVSAWTVAITGDITGNLSGSVGSVNAGVTLADAVAHGGSSATLQLGSNSGYAFMAQSSANGYAGVFFGGGNGGAGAYMQGGAGSPGLQASGGAGATGDITGDISGSITSVGSVSGDVAGNVLGGVVGSVGSVVGLNTALVDAAISSRSTYAGGAVASVTGDVGGDVVGTVKLDATQADYAPAKAGDAMTLTGAYATGSDLATMFTTLTTHGDSFWITATGYAVAGDAMTLTVGERTAIATAIFKLDLSTLSGEASRSLLNAVRKLRNKWSISGTTLTVYKEDDSTTAYTQSLTATPGASPITGIS